VSLFPESESELVRQISYALEDQSFDPLDEVQQQAPEGCDYVSDLEVALSDWAFCYGVAWTLARMHDPFASSERIASAVQRLSREAWRSRSGTRAWGELIGEDRNVRGPVRHDPHTELQQFTESIGKMRARRVSNPISTEQ
jgi:hypothetical protein